MTIRIENLNKTFGQFTALSQINLEFPQGEFTALLGPSGCGKTTLLRIIAGLDFADSGNILFSGREVSHLSAKERKVGFVFQHYALFRHLTIFENVAFGLRIQPRKQRLSAAEIEQRVMELLRLVQLEKFAQSYPDRLSGGQRQRVALARALAVKPEVLLLDEPFSALDAQVRKTLRRWLAQLQKELNITSIFVTHDQEEALEVADRIVVMNQGKIEQVDQPEQVYHAPQSQFVNSFVGDSNVFRGVLDQENFIVGEFAHRLTKQQTATTNGDTVAYVRPYELTLSRSAENALAKGEIVHIYSIGFLARIEIMSAQSEQPIEVLLTKEKLQTEQFKVGETVFLIPDNLSLFQNMNI
ncbi:MULTISPECIES: sulfate/molybdate ABC transporter ATP-binding protein [Gallibacterium]|uniref:Sulfate ABC transporter ATP-binding protein n=1 Tax=Gallibacterium genomosp. 3 TaxID=505345 RepID=A0A1A7Q0E7_9PAST|nr:MULTISPECIES: sulfate ABC transporter ATP-binding protein [Gallibacterium]MDA3977520.1 sulfate ABC transporter ATP-binding protein [Gallibacterium sp. AGMB14963]OBX07417.1 sulfate ABC transporter ATP-binding protein [Gallibacterium genomosp. 3]